MRNWSTYFRSHSMLLARVLLIALPIAGCSGSDTSASSEQSTNDFKPEYALFECPFNLPSAAWGTVSRQEFNGPIVYSCSGTKIQLHKSFIGHRRWTTDQLGISVSSLVMPHCKLDIEFRGSLGTLSAKIVGGPYAGRNIDACFEGPGPL